MTASLPATLISKPGVRTFNVDYFLRKTERRANGIRSFTELQGTEKVLDFPQQPNNVEIQDKHSYQVFYNVNGQRVIRRPIESHKPKSITLAFSVSANTIMYPEVPRAAADTPHVPLGPVEVLKAFNDLVQKVRGGIDKYDLVDLKNGVVYTDCELDGFTVLQNVGTQRFGYTVSITLTAFAVSSFVGVINQPIVPDVLVLKTTQEISAFQSYLNTMSSLTDKCRGVSAFVRNTALEATDIVESAVSAPLDLINAAASVPLAIAAAVGDVYQTVSDLRSAVLVTANNVEQAANAVGRAVSGLLSVATLLGDSAIDVYSLFTGGSAKRSSLNLAQSPVGVWLGQAESSLLAMDVQLLAEDAELVTELAYGYAQLAAPPANDVVTLGSFLNDPRNVARLASFAGQAQSNPSARNVEALPYLTRLGESLMEIADRLTGDPSRWVELAELNSWTSPYTDANDVVAPAGTRIFIPLTFFGNINRTSNLNVLANKGDALLTDLRLVDGDIVLEGSGATISGVDNFRQAVINRVRTTTGDVMGLPSYGLNQIGLPSVSFVADAVVSQLLSDPRVYSISDVSVVLNGDYIDVNLEVLTVDQQTTQLVVPLN